MKYEPLKAFMIMLGDSAIAIDQSSGGYPRRVDFYTVGTQLLFWSDKEKPQRYIDLFKSGTSEFNQMRVVPVQIAILEE
jgi:hypothetical protein